MVYKHESFMTTQDTTTDMGRTTISVSEATADELHAMKERGESYDDVVRRLIEEGAADE